MVCRDINKVILSKNSWTIKQPQNYTLKNLGWDTETIEGKLILLSNSNKETWIYNKDFFNIEELFEVITRKEYLKKINWFYNLSYDTNAFLTYLHKDNLLELIKLGYTDYKGFRIKVIIGKELSISRLKKDNTKDNKLHSYNTIKFYDAACMYDYKKLGDLALKYTQYKKVDITDIKNLNMHKILHDLNYRNLIKDRCVYDCLILKELMNIFTEKVYNIVNLNTFRSKASISREYIRTNLNKDLKMPSKKFINMALKSYHGGMIETIKLGTFKKVYNADINSAYPSIFKNLNTVDGEYQYDLEYNPDATYSYYNIDIDYSNDIISPFYYNKLNKIYHPTGRFNIITNKIELEFLINKGIDFKILNASHILNKNNEKPFYYLIDDLYNMRVKAKKDDEHLAKTIKFILNSMYGITLNTFQKNYVINNICDSNGNLTKEFIDNIDTIKDEIADGYTKEKDRIEEFKSIHIATNLYNPLFADSITKGTKIQVFNTFWNELNNNTVISINTDGVYLENRKNIKYDKKLGGWDEKFIPEMIMLGNGRYISKDNKGLIDASNSANRGLIGSPEEVFNNINNNITKGVIEIEKDHVIKLKESMVRKEYEGKLNIFVKGIKKMYARADKRYWYDEINTFEDIIYNKIESRPFNIDEIELIK